MNEVLQATDQPSRAERFVGYLQEKCAKDKGFAARLRRADNPATEYQSWDLLVTFGVPLAHDQPRLAYQTIAAAIARSKEHHAVGLSLGRALAACYEDGRESDQARARLRRLLACDDAIEVCRVLRAQLSLIASRAGQSLDFVRLLNQLLRFDRDSQRIKAQWAQEFYGQSAGESV